MVPDKWEFKSLSEARGYPHDINRTAFHFAGKLEELEKSGYFCKHPQLTLSDLAFELSTNRTTLSQYLNSVKGVSFYDYINDSRLASVESLVMDDSLTYDEIAFRAGFNSTSTFRRAFSKKYGLSPVEYRRQSSHSRQ